MLSIANSFGTSPIVSNALTKKLNIDSYLVSKTISLTLYLEKTNASLAALTRTTFPV